MLFHVDFKAVPHKAPQIDLLQIDRPFLNSKDFLEMLYKVHCLLHCTYNSISIRRTEK